jgi:hypothetical protein
MRWARKVGLRKRHWHNQLIAEGGDGYVVFESAKEGAPLPSGQKLHHMREKSTKPVFQMLRSKSDLQFLTYTCPN